MDVLDKSKYGVHETHCCVVHGCKYYDEDCPVETGEIEQENTCMDCSDYYSQLSGGLEASRAKIKVVRETKRAVARGENTVEVDLVDMDDILGVLRVESFDPNDYYYPGDRYIESLRALTIKLNNARYVGKRSFTVYCRDVLEVVH